MPKFNDIPRFPRASYTVDVPWDHLENHLASWDDPKGKLVLDPDFQRAHVWTRAQQVAYVEYKLQGGEVGGNIVLNCPRWMEYGEHRKDPIELVDGKQRLEAVRAFMRSEFPVFGHAFAEYTDRLHPFDFTFKFCVCKLTTRAEILQLYLNINAGGTPHTAAEINKVRAMLGRV